MAQDRTYAPAPAPLPFPVADNHTHIEPFQRFPAEPLGLEEQITAAQAVGVSRIVQCGCDLAAARWTVEVAVKQPGVVGAIAIHPNDAARLAAVDRAVDPPADRAGGPGADPTVAPNPDQAPTYVENSAAYTASFAEIASLARSTSRVRAIGETGLDYFRTGPGGRPAQRAAFRDHIALAKELDLALQIHDRDAHADVIATLLSDGAPERTIFHCFSGDREMATVAASHGWYCSFAGTVTFKSGGELRLAASQLPPELVLVETDAPYLAPDPFRGRPNAPFMIPVTMGVLAASMGLPLEDACRQIQDNTYRAYGEW
ncbi:MAG: TatD family hydrolase [Bifidobacteriaceae bacterium]|jgi:TatD DNase family protein|nr:TatD family hydrolase [Bifidobacteriaceae bacterium]